MIQARGLSHTHLCRVLISHYMFYTHTRARTHTHPLHTLLFCDLKLCSRHVAMLRALRSGLGLRAWVSSHLQTIWRRSVVFPKAMQEMFMRLHAILVNSHLIRLCFRIKASEIV